MIDIRTILKTFYPGKEWAIKGDEYEALECMGWEKPTLERLIELNNELSKGDLVGFYLDANGTDGTNPELVDRVYPDGQRIPLSEPEPVQPSWEVFRQQVMQGDVYDTVAAGSPGKISVLTNLLFQVSDNPDKLPEAVFLWNAMVGKVSLLAEHITQLRDAATAANLPLVFNDAGMITA